jgi:hypothetical protein
MSGTQFSFGDPAPAPLAYTIADTDWQSMVQSYLFHKFAMANPDSALTKNLNAALKKGDAKSIKGAWQSVGDDQAALARTGT